MIRRLAAVVARAALGRARRLGVAALAAAVVLATLAVAGSVLAQPAPTATSGNLLLSKGVFSPLADVPESPGRTVHLANNNRGQTVGTYDAGAGSPPHGFLRDKRGRFTRFDVPGASSTLPLGINDRGRVVGFYGDSGRPNGVGGSFLREPDGEITPIDVPGAFVAQAHGINNRGEVVGFYGDVAPDADGTVPPNSIHGFVLRKGSFRTIDVPGAIGTIALDLNDRGEIIGSYADEREGDPKGITHGFRLRKGVFTTIDPPGAVDIEGTPGFRATVPFGINNRGQVVGQYADLQGLHAYLLDDGVYRTIDPPAGPGTTATDINDRGQIVIPKPRGLFIGR